MKSATIIILILFVSINTCQRKDLSSAIYSISHYISSENFNEILRESNDLAVVDSIYYFALRYFENDHSEALLALTFATLPFNVMPVKIPIVGIELDLGLPSPNDSLFIVKNRSLPKNLFFDSPKTEFGDKDKLAHFFGNAFLSYNISFFNLSKFMGIFVEMFEATFKVQGGLDFKDIKINHLGEFFGILLNEHPELMPSEILRVYSLFYFVPVFN